jgi:elongation factor Tu
MEIRDLLSFYEYDGTMDHIQGSALGVNNDPAWVLKILELMEAVDAWIEEQDVASLSIPVECILNYWSWNCSYRSCQTGLLMQDQLV